MDKFDLEERTAKFSEDIIELCKQAQKDTVSKPIINQLIRVATSIGDNYCEANGASSKKDFTNKIFSCKKEARETKYWLRIIVKSNPELIEKSRQMWQEAQELTLIFSKIAKTSKLSIENSIKIKN
jgi:four helix bundle protein